MQLEHQNGPFDLRYLPLAPAEIKHRGKPLVYGQVLARGWSEKLADEFPHVGRRAVP
jgi:hypothetical protein